MAWVLRLRFSLRRRYAQSGFYGSLGHDPARKVKRPARISILSASRYRWRARSRGACAAREAGSRYDREVVMAAAPKINVHDAVNEEHPAINSILGANPFIDLQPKQLIGMVTELGRFLTSRPDSVMSRMGQLAIDLVQIGLGNSEIAPQANDKRFADPAFAQNPLY